MRKHQHIDRDNFRVHFVTNVKCPHVLTGDQRSLTSGRTRAMVPCMDDLKVNCFRLDYVFSEIKLF